MHKLHQFKLRSQKVLGARYVHALGCGENDASAADTHLRSQRPHRIKPIPHANNFLTCAVSIPCRIDNCMCAHNIQISVINILHTYMYPLCSSLK